MATKTILIIGGYGGTGKVLCKYLLQHTALDLVIAGRDLVAAQELSTLLQNEFGSRINSVFADVSDRDSLMKAYENVDMVIDATNATKYILNVATTALDKNIDYLDFHFDQNVVTILNTLSGRIKQSKRAFITQAGFHPGLPSVFVRYAADGFEEYKKANIGICISARIEKADSIYELVDMISDYKVEIFKDGKWRSARNSDMKKFDFEGEFKKKMCYPMQMEEMKALPEMFGLEETGVYVAGFNWFVDYIVFPLAFILFKIKKGLGRDLVAKLMTIGMNHFSPVLGVSMVLEAGGTKDGKIRKIKITARHSDAYAFTVIPIVACLNQYLKGQFVEPGLFMMGHLVDPEMLFEDMKKLGLEIEMNDS